MKKYKYLPDPQEKWYTSPMKVLLINPKFAPTIWSFEGLRPFTGTSFRPRLSGSRRSGPGPIPLGS